MAIIEIHHGTVQMNPYIEPLQLLPRFTGKFLGKGFKQTVVGFHQVNFRQQGIDPAKIP